MIEDTTFGSVVIDGQKYDHDVVIFPDKIIKRKKSITKEVHGTSHKFTRKEMETYLDMSDGEIDRVLVGTGQYGKLGLLPETKEMLEKEGIEYTEIDTPKLTENYDEYGKRENTIVIIHVTC